MLDKQQTYLDYHGTTIKTILGNLIEVKTVSKDIFTNFFSYQVILVFCKKPMLLSLIRPILRHPLSVKITGFIPFRQKHLWDLMLKVVIESLSFIVILQLFLFLDLDGLFQDYSRFTRIMDTFILFIILDSSCSFLSSEMEVFMAMVSVVNLVTAIVTWIALSQRSEIYYLLLSFLLIVNVITLYSQHYQLYSLYGDSGNNLLLVYLI